MNKSTSARRARTAAAALIVSGVGLLLALSLSRPARAAACQSAGSGDWNAPATWSDCGGGAPGATDDVTIDDGHTVTIPAAAGDVAVNNLTIESGGELAASANILTVNGDWGGAGDFTHGGGTVRFAGSGAQAITNSRTGSYKRFYHLDIQSEVTASFSLGLAGNLAVGSGGSLSVANALQYELSGAAGLDCDGPCSFGSLVVRNVDASSSTATIRVGGDFSDPIASPTFKAPPAMEVGGDWLFDGAFDANGGAVTLNGPAGQAIAGSNTFYNLTIANSNGVSLSQDQAVSQALTLSSGRLDLAGHDLTVGAGGSIGGGSFGPSRMVIADSGSLCKSFSGGGSFTFPIGDRGGPDYSPAGLSLSGGSGAVCARVSDAAHPDNTETDKISRYWTLSAAGLSGYVATLSFTYTGGDVEGTEANLHGLHRVGSEWEILDAANPDSHSFGGSVSSLGEFTAGSSSLPVTLSYFAAEKSPGGATQVRWQTATEVGVLGFNVLVETEQGRRQANAEPVASAAGDSLAPQDYRITLPDLPEGRLYLEEVDALGRRRLHGPFQGAGAGYGAPVQADPIDWAAIAAGHAALEAERRRAWADQTRARLAADQVPGVTPAAGAANVPAADFGELSRAAMAHRVFLPAIAGLGDPAIPLARFLVDRDGIYRVTYQDLAAAGVDLAGVPAASLALSSQGQSVALYASGATLGPGVFLEFSGQGLRTLYSRDNVYLLALDAARAAPVAEVDAAPPAGAAAPFYRETITVERDRAYSFAAPNGDPWYDTRLMARSGAIRSDFDLEAAGLVTATLPATLTVDLWGGSDWPGVDPDHHVIVRVNGQAVAGLTFDGIAHRPVEAALPAGLLRRGHNDLTIELPGDAGVPWDVVMLDHFALAYARAFEAREDRLEFEAAGSRFTVGGLSRPEVIVYRQDGGRTARLAGVAVTPAGGAFRADFAGLAEGAVYRVASEAGLLKPDTILPARPVRDITAGTAPYLIISHPDFLPGAEDLARYHRDRGLPARVVDVEDVYDRFGHGIFDAQAIARYIAFAAAHMDTRTVLLVGGDSYDYHDNLGLGSISFIPSLYAATDPVLVKFAPVDPLYADLDADRAPDLAIGRLPVRTAAELDALVAKTLAYGDKSYGETALFAADSAGQGIAFHAASDGLAGRLPAAWTLNRAYIDALGLAGARAALLDGVNRGAALVSFFGHSGLTHWSFQNLFTAADALSLANAGRPTVITQWGCWNTYHAQPEANTLGHRLLLAGDRGAAAVLGAATLTSSSSDYALGSRVIAAMVQPGVAIGDAIQAAKEDLAQSNPYLSDVLLGWTLLGDPALVVTP